MDSINPWYFTCVVGLCTNSWYDIRDNPPIFVYPRWLALMSWGGARKVPRGVSLGKIKVRGFPASDKFTPVNMNFSHFMACFSEGGFPISQNSEGGLFFCQKKAHFLALPKPLTRAPPPYDWKI